MEYEQKVRKKVCPLCADKNLALDYKNVDQLKKFINDKIFLLTPIDSENLKYQKQQILNSQNISKDFLSKNLFKIEASFVRNTLEKISDLRKMYVSIIKRDLQSQIKDINEILNIIE